MSEEKRVLVQILPKGLFVHANGGFKNINETEKMYNTIYEFMSKNKVSICVVGDKLEFVPVSVIIKRKRSFLSRFFK